MSTKQYVTDTHSLVWYFTENPRLSKKALKAFEKTVKEGTIIIPTVVLAEIMHIAKKGRITMSFAETVKKIEDIRDYFTYVGCGGMLMKRKIPEKIGVFDPIFNPAYFEDPDFCFKSHYAGFKIGWNIAAKIVHLPHQTLGKVNQKDKINQFTSSLKKFRNKWKGAKLPIMYQKKLKQFEGIL